MGIGLLAGTRGGGSNNTLVGYVAGAYYSYDKSVFLGAEATGINLSASVGTNMIAIGYLATATKDNQMVLRNMGLSGNTALVEVVPGKNAATTLGSTTNRWSTVYAGDLNVTGTITVNGSPLSGGGGSGTVTSVTKTTGSAITIGGTATDPTVGLDQTALTITESQVTNLSTDLAGKEPTITAGTSGLKFHMNFMDRRSGGLGLK